MGCLCAGKPSLPRRETLGCSWGARYHGKDGGTEPGEGVPRTSFESLDAALPEGTSALLVFGILEANPLSPPKLIHFPHPYLTFPFYLNQN